MPMAITYDGITCKKWDEVDLNRLESPVLCVYGVAKRIILRTNPDSNTEYYQSSEIIFSENGKWEEGDFRLFVNHNVSPDYIDIGNCLKVMGVIGKLSMSPIIVTNPTKVRLCDAP